MDGGTFLSFEDVGCRRGGRVLFEHLTFSVQTGEALLLTGPNGVGKSSLIRQAAGLLDALSGTISRPVAVSLLAHDLALDDGLSLSSALNFWARLDGAGEDAVGDALSAMALDRLALVPVRYLSSGQKRRAAMARVIAGQSRLWLLDEPGVGLDTASLTLLAAAIELHRRAGGAVIAATHMDLGLHNPRVLNLGDRR